MVKLIDNVNEVLGDDLRLEISPGSKVRIAASHFPFQALLKERREFFIPVAGRCESIVHGSEGQ